MKVPNRLDSVLAEITALNDGGWFSTWYEVIYYDIDAQEWCHYAGSNTFNEHATVLNWRYCSEAFNTNYSNTNTQNLMNGLLLLLKVYPDSKVEIFNERNVAIETGHEYKLITEQISNLLSWGWIHDSNRSCKDFDFTTIHWWYFEVDSREEE